VITGVITGVITNLITSGRRPLPDAGQPPDLSEVT